MYDAEGRLVKDRQEEIDTIIWSVDEERALLVKTESRTVSSVARRTVKEIRRPLTSEKKNLIFEYNSFGQRIATTEGSNEVKHVKNAQTDVLEKSTYYILDAQEEKALLLKTTSRQTCAVAWRNQLSMYEHLVDPEEVKYYLAERNIYGSSRLGTTYDFVNMYNPEPLPSYGNTGNRRYELNNHLGNVLMVITDQVYPLDENDDEETDGYEVGISNTFDYSPFGVQLDGRTMERTIEVCTEVADTVTVYAMNETFDSGSNWIAISTGNLQSTVTYSSGEMIMTKPSGRFGFSGDLGAYKYFSVGEGLHSVTFDIESNNCEVLQIPPSSNYLRTIHVYIRDASDNIVATGSYVTNSGSYSLQFTPAVSGTYKMEFYMESTLNCSFSVDNVIITYEEQGTSFVCDTKPAGYRYGFQAQEKDDEVKGAGNSVNYTYRMHDPRIGRFFAIDPLAYKFPYYSPYQFSSNSVIMAVELEGLETSVQINYTEVSILITRDEYNRLSVTQNQLSQIPNNSYTIGNSSYGYTHLQPGGQIDVWCSDCNNPAPGPRGTGYWVSIKIPTADVIRYELVEKMITEEVDVEDTKTVMKNKKTKPLPIYIGNYYGTDQIQLTGERTSKVRELVGNAIENLPDGAILNSIDIVSDGKADSYVDYSVAIIGLSKFIDSKKINRSTDSNLKSQYSVTLNYSISEKIKTTRKEIRSKIIQEKVSTTESPLEVTP